MWVLEFSEENYDWHSTEVLALSEDIEKLKAVALETANESETPVEALDWQNRGLLNGGLTASDPDDSSSFIRYNIYQIEVI